MGQNSYGFMWVSFTFGWPCVCIYLYMIYIQWPVVSPLKYMYHGQGLCLLNFHVFTGEVSYSMSPIEWVADPGLGLSFSDSKFCRNQQISARWKKQTFLSCPWYSKGVSHQILFVDDLYLYIYLSLYLYLNLYLSISIIWTFCLISSLHSTNFL